MNYQINISHPWNQIIYSLDIKLNKEKEQEFYNKFGYYLYSNDTEEYRTKAFRFLIKNKIFDINKNEI